MTLRAVEIISDTLRQVSALDNKSERERVAEEVLAALLMEFSVYTNGKAEELQAVRAELDVVTEVGTVTVRGETMRPVRELLLDALTAFMYAIDRSVDELSANSQHNATKYMLDTGCVVDELFARVERGEVVLVVMPEGMEPTKEMA